RQRAGGQRLPDAHRPVERAGHERPPVRIEADARHRVAVSGQRCEQAAVLAVVETRGVVYRADDDLAAVRVEGRRVDAAGRADEVDLPLAARDVPDVAGAVGARRDERLAVGREALVEDVAVVDEDMEELAGARVPEARGEVVAAAREQPAVRAEGERLDLSFGKAPDPLAGARVDELGGRSLAVPERDREHAAIRVERGGDDAAGERERPRPAADPDEPDVPAARREEGRLREREGDDRRAGLDGADGEAPRRRPDRDGA